MKFNYKSFGREVGILEEYRALEKDNIRTISLTVGVDVLGKIANPYTLDLSRGFLPVGAIVESLSDISVFCRGHKSLYIPLSDIATICKGVIKVNTLTGSVIPEKSRVAFYVPSTYTEDAIVCSTIGTEVPYSSIQLSKLENSVYTQVSNLDTLSRQSFLFSRLFNEGR